MSKENKRLFQTIFISGIATVFSYLINFMLTPYISNHVGIEAYGFVSIAKTAVSYAQIITVALTTFIVRYITLNYHKNKIEEANSYYSSSILACFQLSGALLIFALLCIDSICKSFVYIRFYQFCSNYNSYSFKCQLFHKKSLRLKRDC